MQKTLGQKIKELRLNKKMTQGELGHGLATPSMISQIEADKASPSHKLLADLAERLGVTLQYFLEDIQSKLERNGTIKYARMLMDAENYKKASQLFQDLLREPVPHIQIFEIQMDLAYCLHKLRQTQKSINLYESILQDSLSENEPVFAVRALKEMGQIEYERGNLVLAHFHLTKSVSIGLRDVQNDADLLADILLLLAGVQNQLGDNSEALRTLRTVESRHSQVHDMEKHARLAQIFSEVYKDAGDYQHAADYARSALSVYDDLNLSFRSTHMKITLAQIYDESGSSEEALQILEECLEQANPNLMEEIPDILIVMTRIFLRLQKLDTAKAYCDKVLASAFSDTDALIQSYRTLAEIALKNEQFPEAIYNCEQVIHLSQKQHRIPELSRSFTLLCNIYKQQGDFMAAADTFLRMQESLEHHLREKAAID